jgi:hypothetical protein
MMPSNYQHVPDLRRLRISAPIVATKPGNTEETSSTIGRIIKRGAKNSFAVVL